MNYRIYLEKSPPTEKGPFRAKIDIQMRKRTQYKRIVNRSGLTPGEALMRAAERLQVLEEEIENPT